MFAAEGSQFNSPVGRTQQKYHLGVYLFHLDRRHCLYFRGTSIRHLWPAILLHRRLSVGFDRQYRRLHRYKCESVDRGNRAAWARCWYPGFLSLCYCRNSSLQTPRPHDWSHQHIYSPLQRIWPSCRPSIHPPHGGTVALELLLWHHPQWRRYRPMGHVLFPSPVQHIAPNALPVATIPHDRLRGHHSLLRRHATLPHGPVLGRLSISLEVGPGYRDHCRWSGHVDCFHSLRYVDDLIWMLACPSPLIRVRGVLRR